MLLKKYGDDCAMSRLKNWHFIVPLALFAASCQTTGSVDKPLSETVYNIFFTPQDHISELLAAGNLRDADEVYKHQRAEFKKEEDPKEPAEEKSLGSLFNKTSTDKAKSLKQSVPEQLAAAISESLNPQALEVLSGLLKGDDWPVNISEWGQIEIAIDEARDLVSQYESYSIFNEEDHRPDQYIKIKAKLENLIERIDSSRDDLFLNHDLVGQPNFITAFPLKTRRADILVGKEETWR